MDIRLDFINKFKDQDIAIDEMTRARKDFMKIDENLVALLSECDDPAFKRAIACARTHNEEALQYTIKSLCLKWEEK